MAFLVPGGKAWIHEILKCMFTCLGILELFHEMFCSTFISLPFRLEMVPRNSIKGGGGGLVSIRIHERRLGDGGRGSLVSWALQSSRSEQWRVFGKTSNTAQRLPCIAPVPMLFDRHDTTRIQIYRSGSRLDFSLFQASVCRIHPTKLTPRIERFPKASRSTPFGLGLSTVALGHMASKVRAISSSQHSYHCTHHDCCFSFPIPYCGRSASAKAAYGYL